jgi:hypothetical protein
MFLAKKKKVATEHGIEYGLVVFESTTEVIQAESALKKEGIAVKVMGPPPEIQTGCDMVLKVSLNQTLEIQRVFKKHNLEPIEFVPVNGPLLKPVSLFHVRDYGDYIMVRAANMKMTVEKNSHKIVNVSGGGCPDVPFLAKLMIGGNLRNAPQPVEYGATLCGYALQLAYDELVRICLNEES